MAKAVALVRLRVAPPIEMVRTVLVAGCAIALIAAGQALPL